jgi:hypothetical protein
MDKWCAKSLFELFVRQGMLATAIQDCHLEIDGSINKLQVRVAYAGDMPRDLADHLL